MLGKTTVALLLPLELGIAREVLLASCFVFRCKVCWRALYGLFVRGRWHSSRDCGSAVWIKALFDSRGDNELLVNNKKS